MKAIKLTCIALLSLIVITWAYVIVIIASLNN